MHPTSPFVLTASDDMLIKFVSMNLAMGTILTSGIDYGIGQTNQLGAWPEHLKVIRTT